MKQKYEEFVMDELDEFYKSVEYDKRKIRLLPRFKSDVKESSLGNFELGEIKKKFKPIIKHKTKTKPDKGIF
jgi:hypothetical protein